MWTQETTKRALRTFLQAFVGYILVNLPMIDWTSKEVLKTTGIGILMSAIAAGIAAMMNLDLPEGNTESDE